MTTTAKLRKSMIDDWIGRNVITADSRDVINEYLIAMNERDDAEAGLSHARGVLESAEKRWELVSRRWDVASAKAAEALGWTVP